jgi:4,4'-diapophytoene synthase
MAMVAGLLRMQISADTASVSDELYQASILQGVSRTFALTIPQLPLGLRKLVGNAYLLCRIADTIEDEVSFDGVRKRYFADQFVKVVAGTVSAEQFSAELYPLLSETTLPSERDLIRHTPKVIRVTHGFTPNQRSILARCIAIMAQGMAQFQANKHDHGLRDLRELDAYCYYVAGVVGEMLTELFCDYSSDLAVNRKRMLRLAVSFGQGLQMTNILKDVWEDRSRGACWLPQDIFRPYGYDLRGLSEERHPEAFAKGMERLIAIAHGHLQNALSYTLLIPKREKGIRKFCLWATGMALLTLRKIRRNPDFTSGNEVKISRRSVIVAGLLSDLWATNDRTLRWLFRAVATGLPPAPPRMHWGVAKPRSGSAVAYEEKRQAPRIRC